MTSTRTEGSGESGAAAVAPVLAAGTVCWRWSRAAEPEVLLVHRPRYDDWSWPKGKARRRDGAPEPLPACAVRETAEETGLRVPLGRPLPPVQYDLPDGRPKQVRMWTARAPDPSDAPGPPRRGPEEEVDRATWTSPPRARELLTYAADVALLDTVLAWGRQGTLATVPLVVVRHGKARPRASWSRADTDRPLVAAGRRQADALAELLDCWRPARVVSSPSRRCVDTIGPYLRRSGAKVALKDGLGEDGFERDPRKAVKHARRLLDRGRPALLCTHRPVLPAVLDLLAEHAADGARDALAGGPLAPGEVLVAHVARVDRRPAVVAVERLLLPA